VEHHALLDDDYTRERYSGRSPRLLKVLLAYLGRMRVMLTAGHYDVVWVEKEVLPWFPEWCEGILLRGCWQRLVMDFDDAVWVPHETCRLLPLRRLLRGKVPQLMASAGAVVAGNAEIARYAEECGAQRVVVVPTVVDIHRYLPEPAPAGPDPVVCWIGTPITAVLLDVVRHAFVELARQHRFVFRIIGAQAPNWPGVRTESIPWSEETEVRELNTATVGVMPLWDGAFQRGKCGYKLIQYMASGLPVVASPVGVNSMIVTQGWNGYLAQTPEEWQSSLVRIFDDPPAAREMGRRGRSLAEREYSLDSALPKLAALLEACAHPGAR
jgi:glycosyltransferase involved in cell wall biosynthesis